MVENLTHEHKLIEDITSPGWLANPAGKQGYQVIVLEKVGDGGTRFYCSLKPGETLRLSERLFGKYIALAVDVRGARSFPIEGEFSARERGRKVMVQANVRYRVTDARVVAMETVDPLGELRDKVIAALNRELMAYPEASITPNIIERIVRSIGPVPHLGLMVEDAEVLGFTPDVRSTEHALEAEDFERRIAVDLTDLNVLMHEHPDIIPQVWSAFADKDKRLLEAQIGIIRPALDAYIRQQQEREAEIDPQEIINLMRQAIAPLRIQLESPLQSRQIVWGDEVIDALPSGEPPTAFGDKEKPGEETGDKGKEDPSRIKFGD